MPVNASTATASWIGALNSDQTRFSFTVTGIDIVGAQTPGNALDNLTGFHIHRAVAGVSGGIVHNPDTDAEFVGNAAAGTLAGGCDAAEGLGGVNLTALNANGTYFNVHTVAFGGGEIRGWIIKADSGLDRIDLTRLHIGSLFTVQQLMTETAGSTTITALFNSVASAVTLTLTAAPANSITVQSSGGNLNITAADFVFF